MLEDKQKRAIRIRCEKIYGEWVCHRMIVLVGKGLKASEIAVVLKGKVSEYSIRRWMKKL